VQVEPDVKFRSVASLLEDRIDALAAATYEHLRTEIPEWLERPELSERGQAFARESILAELAALQNDASLPDACPAVDAEAAKQAARLGAPLSSLLSGYRAGHAAQWAVWFDLVEQHAATADERRALLERGSRFFFAYADLLSRFVSEEHSRERDRIIRSHEQRRVNLVRELLNDADVDARILEYDVEHYHIGTIVWGPEAADAARDLAKQLNRRLLLVGVIDETWWAWLGSSHALDDRSFNALGHFEPPPETRLALGAEGSGIEGFRRTHRQAVTAQRAALDTGAPVTRYEDIALEALAAQDEDEAREFIRRELRGLDGDDLRSRRLRETLRAYFSAGQNAAATAAALGLHEQTVAQRLRAVEERIGRPVPSRRAELETALRLRRYLSSRSGSGPGFEFDAQPP
jgi:hypothetical protein